MRGAASELLQDSDGCLLQVGEAGEINHDLVWPQETINIGSDFPLQGIGPDDSLCGCLEACPQLIARRTHVELKSRTCGMLARWRGDCDALHAGGLSPDERRIHPAFSMPVAASPSRPR